MAIAEGEIQSKAPCYTWLEEIWVAAATSVTQKSLCGTRGGHKLGVVVAKTLGKLALGQLFLQLQFLGMGFVKACHCN